MEDANKTDQPRMLIPRYMYGTKKAVLGRCKTVMRHLFKRGTLPPSFNDDLIDAHSVEGQILMEMELYQAVREHFHLYCLAEAFGEVKYPHHDSLELYTPFKLIVASEAVNHPWSTLALLCQGAMNWRNDAQRQPILEALLRHWPAIRSVEDKMQYEGIIHQDGKAEDENGYIMFETAYWLRVTQGCWFWGELAIAGISQEEVNTWRSMEHSLDNLEDLIAEAIRLNQLKIDTHGPGQIS
jgi:hypothetical protein